MDHKPKHDNKSMEEIYLDLAGVIIVVIDACGKVLLINKKGCEVLEYKNEEIIGKDWFRNFLPKKVSDEVRNVFKEIIANKIKNRESYNNPVLTKRGEERIISWRNSILRDESGKTRSFQMCRL